MAFGDADLAYMMSDVFSVPVVYGSQKTSGILDVGDHLVPDGQFGQVQIRATTLSIKTGSLTGLAEDALITVDGTRYKMRLPSKMDDGSITTIMLAEA